MALPTSGNISLQDIETEFGAASETPLTDFVRGGAYVPDTAANANIPETIVAPDYIKITDFYGGTSDILDYNVSSPYVYDPDLIFPTGQYSIVSGAVNLGVGLMAFVFAGSTNTSSPFTDIQVLLYSYSHGTLTQEDVLGLSGIGPSTSFSGIRNVSITADTGNKLIYVSSVPTVLQWVEGAKSFISS